MYLADYRLSVCLSTGGTAIREQKHPPSPFFPFYSRSLQIIIESLLTVLQYVLGLETDPTQQPCCYVMVRTREAPCQVFSVMFHENHFNLSA